MVEPTNLKPRFLRSFAHASLSGLVAGRSLLLSHTKVCPRAGGVGTVGLVS